MKHESHYCSAERRWYFVVPSNSSNVGGLDDHFEVIKAYHPRSANRWNTSNMMVALVHDEALAEHIARLLAQHPFVRDC